MISFKLLVLFLLTTAHSDAKDAIIEMDLDFHPQYKTLLLNVTEFNRQQTKSNWIKFNDNSLYCIQSDDPFMSSKNNTTIRVNKVDEQSGQFVKYLYYDVMVEAEGFVQCHYNSTTSRISSNVAFYRFNNNVFVLHLNNISNVLTKKQLAVNLEKLIGHSNFTASIKKIKSTVHLTSTVKLATAKSDSDILNQLREIVEAKIKPVYDVIGLRSTRYCPSYNITNLVKLPQTQRGTLATTSIIDKQDFPFTVRCIGNFYEGVYWNETEIETILNSTMTSAPISSAIIADPLDIVTPLEKPYEIQAFAVQLSALGNISSREIPQLTLKMNELLSKGAEVFKGLHRNLNTSNEILASLDRVLINTRLIQGSEQSIRPNFAARIEDLPVTLGAGMVVFDSEGDEKSKLSKESFQPITQNMTNNDIQELEPRAALRLPDSLLTRNDTPGRLALAVFPSGAFFSELPTSDILSANLGGQTFRNLKDPVHIWFRRDVTQHPEPGLCVSWDYGLNGGRGNWSTTGCHLLAVHNTSQPSVKLEECACFHLTHFGELFWPNDDAPMMEQIHPSHTEALDLITLTGCVLSLVGLSGVFATAIVSPEWIRGSGQKIQLQISINLAMVITLFLIVTNVELPSFACVFTGILLHYSMLSNFCWMLLAAFLQYTRLVKVVSTRSSRLPLKAGLIGWMLPMLPCVSIIISGQFQVYSPPPLCLPHGIAFYASVLTPLSLVMCCNVVIFLLIARNLYVNISIRRHEKHCLSLRRFKQLVFLFVLLGLSWLFALAQLMFPKPWMLLFSYLFCLCIALQGITYFVFFVLMDDHATNGWRHLFCPSHPRYDAKRYTLNSRIVSSSGSHGATEVTTKPL